MSMNNPANSNANQKTATGYETPQGVFEGLPPISYPNTPGFTPATRNTPYPIMVVPGSMPRIIFSLTGCITL